jgi:hypothetical protein
VTGDLLSAASILAGLLTFLYGNAYSAITDALKLERGERHYADLSRERRQVRDAIAPALGVFATGLALAGIFFWKVVELIRTGDVFSRYDPVALSFLVVWLAFVLVAAHAAWSTWRLAGKYRELALQ